VSPNPLLEINQLSAGYRRPLFQGLDLVVQPREIISILGENGSGKTTLIDILMGLKKPSFGSISFFGRSTKFGSAAELNQRTGWVISQEEAYPPFLTVDGFFRILRPCFPRWDQQLVHSLAERFSLNLDKKLTHLSLGEASKVKLIKALAHHPDLLVLDELTANLSESSKSAIMECLMDQFAARSMGILYFCHVREEAVRISDRILRLTPNGLNSEQGGAQ